MSQKTTKKSIKNLINLYSKQIDNFDLELLLAKILKKDHSFILANPDYLLNKKQQGKLLYYVKKRRRNTPLAYILGKKDFYGYTFRVNKNVLIPRPETEMFVDFLKNSNIKNNSIIVDVGTGSGCILISLFKELKKKNILPKNSEFIGLDKSNKALQVARINKKRLGHKKDIKFIQSNLLSTILNSNLKNEKYKNLVISANLPYLSPKQIKNSPSIQKEPRIALEAGEDGLKYYKKLFKQVEKIQNNFENILILCEIDNSQKEKIEALSKKNLPDFQVKTKKDLRGLWRLVVLTKKNQI